MSEPDSPTRGDLHHQHHQQLHQSSSQHNVDERDDANSSIIGKVKSRVSSIFPQTLTKWFSPSTTPTTAATASNGGVSRRRRRNEDCEDEDYERANNSDNESNNSAEDEDDISPAPVQPPTKRSRLNVEASRANSKETQSFSSSTPTTAVRRRTTAAAHLNLYGKQKEPAFNFTQTKITTTTNTTRMRTLAKNSTVDSADIIEVVPERSLNTSISSRRSLNIASTSFSEGYRNLRDLKNPSSGLGLRTSSSISGSPSLSARMQQHAEAKILDATHDEDEEEVEEEGQLTRNATIVVEEVDEDDDVEDDNEESEEIAKVTSKKQKFTNGNVVGRSSSVATESGESRSSSVQAAPTKSGMFNPANRGMRTLSGNGLNFYSHLEGRKSLFSEKNMPGMLNNSTLSLTSLNRRQFNSSIYGSTSALSDSRLLNTSSPFYKGQTTYGGAAAYNTFNRSLNQSVRIAPTLIRPTSSLSTLSSSSNSLVQGAESNSTISSTAKRILELINDFSTPLNDAKKMASNIKTPAMWANSTAAGKRFSEADLASSRSVRLSTVRSPYFRPNVTLNPSNSDSKKLLPPLKELHVPSMSQLLQMKKMLSCTERSRQIATTSKSALNQECEYKLPGEDNTESEKTGNKHVSKIRNKVTATSRVSSKSVNLQDEEAPAPANLPNVAFPFMHSVPKIDIPLKSNLPAPTAEKKDSSVPVSKETKPIFAFAAASKPAAETKAASPAVAKPAVNFSAGSGVSKNPTAPSSEFRFSSPLNMNHIPLKEDLAPINNFKFSSPVLVEKQSNAGKVAPPTAAPASNTVPQLKTGSVLDALKTNSNVPALTPALSTEASGNTAPFKSTGASLFGAQFKKPSNEWECDACMVRNKDTAQSCVACTTPRKKTSATPALPSLSTPLKNTFGDAFKPKSDTWECSACMVRNKNNVNECVACNTKKPGATAPAAAVKLQTTDAGFKSLVAQQTASKWECDACMTRNDAERVKCVCCEQAKPGTQAVTENVPKFSFGTSSASKFTFGFGNAGGKKEDELKAEASKTENKTGFTFGIPAKTEAVSSTSTAAPAAGTKILFGINPITNSTSSPSSGKDVPDVSKTNMTGFKFGIPPADSSKSNVAPVTTSTAPTGLSKPDAKSTGVKFNLPTTTAENKVSSEAPSSTSSSSNANSSVFGPSFFSTATTSTFGAAPKGAESNSVSKEPNQKSLLFAVPAPVSSSNTVPSKENKGFVFGSSACASSSAPVLSSPASTTNAIKPLTFGSASTSEANSSPPKITFGSPATSTSTASSAANSTVSSGIFAQTTSSAPTFSKPAFGFTFSKEQSSSPAASFGSQVPASTSVDAKSTTAVFGSSVATSSATTAVSSSTPTFLFGKPAATFGANTASTTLMTTSLFGSKPSSVFSGVSAPASSTSVSAVSSTLATNPAPTTTASSTPFVFGRDATSSTSQSNKPLFGSSPFDSGATSAPATTTSSWPTNTFTFGSSKPVEEAKPAPAFGSPAQIFGSATPIFGSTQVSEVKPTQSAPAAVPTFGASATTSLFGSNSTPAPSGSGQPATGNLFSSATSTPLFGSMSFGAAPAAAATPVAQPSTNPAPAATFGSGVFSGFGSIAAAAPSSTSDGASAPKKAEIAFNFGGAQASGNGGFSFGSNNNNKPADTAFKFTASSAPSFNFTGSSEASNTTQPFQFGAPTGTPAVFNFGGVEGSNSGGPFQFNAAAPAAATNNIFAPLPTPGSQTASQQARRKMRTTNRRLTPR